MKRNSLGKTFELLYDILYLLTIIGLSIYFITANDKDKLYDFYGMMSLLLAFGASFHVLPKIIFLNDAHTELKPYLNGISKSISSISIALFYLLLIYFYTAYYTMELSIPITFLIWILVLIHMILSLYPMNHWSVGENSDTWIFLRNIPFLLLQAISMVLYFNIERIVKTSFSMMWVAILICLISYFPVYVGYKKSLKLNKFPIPYTLIYIWMLFMGIAM